MEVCSFVYFESNQPMYLETICVRTNVAQILVVISGFHFYFSGDPRVCVMATNGLVYFHSEVIDARH